MNPSTRSLTIHDIEIRQIIVKELDQFGFAQTITDELNNKFDDELIQSLINTHLQQCFMLLLLLTDLHQEKLTTIFLSDKSKFDEVFKTLILLNKPFFEKEVQKKQHKATGKKQESTWFDVMQILIGAGHQHSEVLNMTYGEFKAYLKAASCVNARKILDMSNAVRMAHHAKDKDYKKYIDELNSV